MAEPWQPRMFQQSHGRQWTDEHQYLYSLLWSAFLDLDAYSASRFRRRFFPYSTNFVVRELLVDDDDVQRSVGGKESRLKGLTEPKLDGSFRNLALWTVIPKLLGPAPYQDARRPERGEREGEIALALGGVVSGVLKENCKIDVAAFRLRSESRPVVPPGLGLGIGQTVFEIVAGRRTARVRLSAAVQIPYGDRIAQLTDPRTWDVFTYWRTSEKPQPDSSSEILMELLLPGGNRAALSKWRELQFAYRSSITPFEARIDYDGVETGDLEAMPVTIDHEAERATDSEPSAGNRWNYEEPWGRNFTHLRGIRGFLSFEKVPARPLWTRFVAEREVRFESPNHDRFRVETLMFWLACDLLSFASAFSPGKDNAPEDQDW